MALTNAEHQALWRRRQKAKLAQAQDDFDLYVRAAETIVRALEAEGKKSAVTTIPAQVRMMAVLLRRLNEAWPNLPPEVKDRLASAKSTTQLSGILRKDEGPVEKYDGELLRKYRVGAAEFNNKAEALEFCHKHLPPDGSIPSAKDIARLEDALKRKALT
jgi:hypothetical protein